MSTLSVTGRLRTSIPLAVAAAVANQVVHEGTHAVCALAVGRLTAVQLFAVETFAEGRNARLLVAGSAALVNIVLAALAFWTAGRLRQPIPRLGLMLFGGFSAATGFGYLMFDPLFASSTNALGDYKQVVQLLGGGVVLRLALVAVGAAGWVGTMFLLARSAWWFATAAPGRDGLARPDRAERGRLAISVLFVPYLTACVFCTILVVPSHPAGADGVVAVLLQYWFGCSLFLWAGGLAGAWLRRAAVPAPTTPLPRASQPALVIGLVALVVALGLTPTWTL